MTVEHNTSKKFIDLDLEDLDQVVGGAVTPQAPTAAVDHSQDQAFLATLGNVAATVSSAAADINATSSHAAADITTVESAAKAAGVSTDAALTALLGATHGNLAVAQELTLRLGGGAAETELAALVSSGKVTATAAINVEAVAINTLAAYSADHASALGMSQKAALDVVELKLDTVHIAGARFDRMIKRLLGV